jgi:hypothetical protein
MIAKRLWALAALPLALAACGGDADDEYVDGDGVVVTGDTSMGVGTVPPPMTDPAASPASVAMNAVGGSGVTGNMEVMAHGEGQTMVSVTLNGPAGASSTHSGHIHEGTCENPGTVVVPLQDVTLVNGTGMAASTVDVPASAAMNGQHIVAYHAGSGDNPGAPVVCGAIPAQTGTTM